MSNFKIEITCKICGSKNVETELWMSQGTGLLHLECRDCDNKPSKSLDDDDLINLVNR